MIHLTFDDGIKELRDRLDPANLVKAQRSALSGIRSQTATLISKLVRQRYNVNSGAIARRLKMGLMNNGDDAYLNYIGTRIGLIEFDAKFKRVSTARGKRWGATARVEKGAGRELAVGGFIAAGNNGNVHIFRRADRNNNKSKIRRMAGPAIPQMVGHEDVVAGAEKFVVEKYPEILFSKLAYFFEKQNGA